MVLIEYQADSGFASTMMVMDMMGFAVLLIRSEGKNDDDQRSL